MYILYMYLVLWNVYSEINISYLTLSYLKRNDIFFIAKIHRENHFEKNSTTVLDFFGG